MASNPTTYLLKENNWLVVSTHLKNIGPNGNLPQIGVKIKNIWNHHLDKEFRIPKKTQIAFLGNTKFGEPAKAIVQT